MQHGTPPGGPPGPHGGPHGEPTYGAPGGRVVDQVPTGPMAPHGAHHPAPGHGPETMPPGRLEVEMKFFPLAWLLYFFKPVVVINGHRNRAKWGLNIFDLPAAQYHLHCFFPYILGDTCPAVMTASIYVGHVTRIRYDVPLILLGSGKIREVGVYPIPGAVLPPGAAPAGGPASLPPG